MVSCIIDLVAQGRLSPRPFLASTPLRRSSSATSKVNGDLQPGADELQQITPSSPDWAMFLAGGFLIAQTCGVHRSLPCRIGRKWSAITDWLATPPTTFHRGSWLCRCGEFRSWQGPIVGRTQERTPLESIVLGRCTGSHNQTSSVAGMLSACIYLTKGHPTADIKR
jgi:hypothetical protein